MTRTETVAVVTMLCDAKAALIPQMTRRWDAIDFGGRRVVYVAVCNDASAETEYVFRNATSRPVVPVRINNVASYVPDMEHERDVRPAEYASNIIYLHRMAIMREAARQTTLNLRDSDGRPVDWALWLDQDVEPAADAFALLHGVLTRNKGPQAPRVACGLYCTRHWGQDITKWLGESGGSYVPIMAGKVQSSRCVGFGCALMRRKTLRDIPFDTYTQYREFRRWQCEINRAETSGVMGEDIWWFRQYEIAYGTAPVVDNRVLCRHYHDDGSYWEYRADADGYLKAHYVTNEVLPGTGKLVRNVGADVIEIGGYGVSIAPGEERRVSGELASSLRNMKARVEVAA